jgi:hypothetical protein
VNKESCSSTGRYQVFAKKMRDRGEEKCVGTFDSYDEALASAKRVVEFSLRGCNSWEYYESYGKQASIRPVGEAPIPDPAFSTLDYAGELAPKFAAEMEANKQRFSHLLEGNWREVPNDICLNVYERSELRDIFTLVVFEDDGCVVFRQIDDFWGDNFGGRPFVYIDLFIIEAEDRNRLFSAFLDPVPETESERREALCKTLKDLLEHTGITNLLEDKNIPWGPAYKQVFR